MKPDITLSLPLRSIKGNTTLKILCALAACPGLSAAGLSQLLGRKRTTLESALSALRKTGYVKPRVVPGGHVGRPLSFYSLTKKGSHWLAQKGVSPAEGPKTLLGV